jgi:hypothetical protein
VSTSFFCTSAKAALDIVGGSSRNPTHPAAPTGTNAVLSYDNAVGLAVGHRTHQDHTRFAHHYAEHLKSASHHAGIKIRIAACRA